MNRMKKHILFGGMLLLAAVFTGCTEDFKDWADPIFNPEPNAITIPGVTATAVAQNVDLGKAALHMARDTFTEVHHLV